MMCFFTMATSISNIDGRCCIQKLESSVIQTLVVIHNLGVDTHTDVRTKVISRTRCVPGLKSKETSKDYKSLY